MELAKERLVLLFSQIGAKLDICMNVSLKSILPEYIEVYKTVLEFSYLYANPIPFPYLPTIDAFLLKINNIIIKKASFYPEVPPCF